MGIAWELHAAAKEIEPRAAAILLPFSDLFLSVTLRFLLLRMERFA